jgi:8-oxo-dGTP diphosphatase
VVIDLDGLGSRAERDGIGRLVVGVVVPRDDTILVLQRRPGDFMANIYELPSGEVEPGETLSAAVTRELREETSLVASSIVGYLGDFDYLSASGAATRQLNFVVVVLEVSEIVHPEHTRAAWVSAATLEHYPVTAESRRVIQRYFDARR